MLLKLIIKTQFISFCCVGAAHVPFYGESELLSSKDDRIIGGEEAGMTDAPWQVVKSLFLNEWKECFSKVSLRNFLGGISHFCGGTIIAEDWVLTAAHCMDGLSEFQYDVMAGEHNIHLPDLHEEMRLVKKAIMHPNYTWNDKEFDIGLVQVASPFKFTDYIQVRMLYGWKGQMPSKLNAA